MNHRFTYDQAQRYGVLRKAAAGRLRILDVGGAAPDPAGGGFWLPLKEEFAAANPEGRPRDIPYCISLDVVDCREPGFVRGAGHKLPFKDGAFDLVSALDVLEHVPAPNRGAFLAEMARVSSDLVVVSCPVKGTTAEKAEEVVAREVERRLGVRHAQLDEHLERGLPEAEEVGRAIAGLRPFVASFGYGSVPSWLVYQTYRNEFLGRRDTARILEALDRDWAGKDQWAEFEPPFYRRYWVASKKGPVPPEINTGTHHLIVLKSGQLSDVSPYLIDMVSAVVLAEGAGERLSRCLNSLLHQKIDFDLEIAVWPLSGAGKDASAKISGWLRERFPAVRLLEPGGAGDSFAEKVYSLRGDFFLLLDDEFELPLEAVAHFAAEAKRRPKNAVFAASRPRVPALEWAWAGGPLSPFKRRAGRRHRPRSLRVEAERGPADMPYLVSTSRRGWVYGDALFFRRFALLSRRPRRPSGPAATPPDKRSFLLFER
jgi:hypothetical protein